MCTALTYVSQGSQNAIAIFSVLSMTATGLSAQDTVGFPPSEFGKIVLSQKQFGGQLETSVGNYNNEPISKYGDRSLFAELGKPVGRLDILTDGGMFPCTAFVVSEKYILTNHHCVPGILENPRAKATRINAVQLVLGYRTDGITDGVQRFTVAAKPVETNANLDYSVLEVFGNPSLSFGRVKLARSRARDRSPLWIIGHPMGEAQRISREDCITAAPAIANQRLRHRCDTLPGNSGSPVIDPALQAAIGLHHAGSRQKSINYAIPMGLIMRQSKVLATVLANPADPVPKPRSDPSARPTAQNQFDGLWLLTRSGPKCRKSNVSFSVRVESSVIRNRRLRGTVSAAGEIKFSHPSNAGPPAPLFYAGKLVGTKGRGTFRKARSRCSGTFTLVKQF